MTTRDPRQQIPSRTTQRYRGAGTVSRPGSQMGQGAVGDLILKLGTKALEGIATSAAGPIGKYAGEKLVDAVESKIRGTKDSKKGSGYRIAGKQRGGAYHKKKLMK